MVFVGVCFAIAIFRINELLGIEMPVTSVGKILSVVSVFVTPGLKITEVVYV